MGFRIILFAMVVMWAQFASALDANFVDNVRKSAVLADGEQILLQSDTYFYPGKKGFSLFSGGKERVKAYFFITQNALYVVDRARGSEDYKVILRERLQDIASVDIVGGSIALRLVTETRGSAKFNSFELLDSRNAVGTNAARTQEAKELIATGMQGLDPRVVSDPKQAVHHQQTIQALEARIERLENLRGMRTEAVQTENAAESKECECSCPPQNEQ